MSGEVVEIGEDMRVELADFVGKMARIQSKMTTKFPELMPAVFIARCGVNFTGRLVGTRHARGVPRQCFDNALRIALRRGSKLSYYEGYGLPKNLVPVEHAWVADEDGNVLDVTWDEWTPTAYFGAKVSVADLRVLESDRRLSVIPPLSLWLMRTAEHKDSADGANHGSQEDKQS